MVPRNSALLPPFIYLGGTMEREFNDQQLARRKKLDDLREKGIRPFGNAYQRNANSKIVKEKYQK